MSIKRKLNSHHALIAMVAILVSGILACASVVPAARAAPLSVTYYANTNNGANFLRSVTPFNFQTTDYTYSQMNLPNGGIRTILTPRTGGATYADFGFGYTFGTLGSISSIPIFGSGSYSVNLWIDMNTGDDVANGPFFAWSGNTFTGVGGDTYGLGPSITNSGTINTASSFFLILDGNTYTISQLQSGAVAGISSSTIVGFWFGVTNHPTTAQFDIYTINGQQVAPPSVGGIWSPITLQILNPMNTLELLGPWIALVFVGVASAYAASRRFLKKRL